MSSFAPKPLTTKTKRTWNALFASALALAAIVGPGVAHADWRFAKWGMSAAELKAASPTPLSDQPARPGMSVLLMEEPFRIEGIPFQSARMVLEGDKLARVILNGPRWTQTDDLLRVLSATFGPPIRSDLTLMKFTYKDAAKGNSIQLQCWKYADCTVMYSPLEEGF